MRICNHRKAPPQCRKSKEWFWLGDDLCHRWLCRRNWPQPPCNWALSKVWFPVHWGTSATRRLRLRDRFNWIRREYSTPEDQTSFFLSPMRGKKKGKREAFSIRQGARNPRSAYYRTRSSSASDCFWVPWAARRSAWFPFGGCSRGRSETASRSTTGGILYSPGSLYLGSALQEWTHRSAPGPTSSWAPDGSFKGTPTSLPAGPNEYLLLPLTLVPIPATDPADSPWSSSVLPDSRAPVVDQLPARG